MVKVKCRLKQEIEAQMHTQEEKKKEEEKCYFYAMPMKGNCLNISTCTNTKH